MIARLVASALRSSWLVLLAACALAVAGFLSYRRLDIEAYPNPVPPLVEIITQPEGWSAEEVERYVTIPLEIGLSGMPGLDHVRSQSLFGLSDIKCYFNWATTYKDARQEAINRIGFVQLPNGVEAKISPWNAIGELFRYTLRGPGFSLKDLKTAQDWILEPQFRRVPGVIDVVGFGGETKQYHVDVDPFRLRGQGATLPQVLASIQNANVNVGGQRLSIGQQSYNVRGVGLLRGTHDIEEVVVGEQNGTATRVKQVAQTEIGSAPRLGIVGHDDEADVVQGIVLMQYEGKTLPTLEGIHRKVDEIRKNHLLPPGMELVPYYDRGDLVKLTTHTVLENLLVGMLLVAGVLVVFLGHTRAALITAINIPLALLAAFCGMVLTHTPANLISLGAVDFGIVVDSTVIMTENVFRHLGKHGRGTMGERILSAAREVGAPMALSALIIGVAFLPLFTMTGVSGVIFAPMAHTYAFAIGAGILLALTLTPVLMARLVSEDTVEREGWLMRTLHRAYTVVFEIGLRHPKRMLAICLVPLGASVALFPLLGGEFMPKLEEGNFWIRATLPTSISLEQSAKYVGRMRRILRGCPDNDAAPCTEASRAYPEVATVVSQLGRPDDGTDVSGFQNIELFAPLKPSSEWRRGVTKEGLTEELSHKLAEAFPGVVFNFSQMISDNVEEALSGVKGENSVKVIGPDVRTNEATAERVEDAMSSVSGVRDLGIFRSLGQPNVDIEVDRLAASRYGLNTGDVEAVVEAAIGGKTVTQIYEGEKHFDLVVRWLEPFRNSVEAIRQLAIPTSSGVNIPLGQVARVSKTEGPSVIYREDGHRYSPVKFSVRGRDLQSTLLDAQNRIQHAVHLDYNTHLEWAGQLSELNEAMGRLSIIIPITLAMIALLVYTAVRGWLDTVIVFVSILVASSGGVLALLIARINFSVSATMGFISIFGIAIQGAILIVTYYQRLREAGLSIEDAARGAAEKRFRPVLMTTLVATLGLLPAALSNGIGAQTQKPLAVVVIGGSLILAVLTRVLQPILLVVAHRWKARRTPCGSE